MIDKKKAIRDKKLLFGINENSRILWI